jgi:hypothetical protein
VSFLLLCLHARLISSPIVHTVDAPYVRRTPLFVVVEFDQEFVMISPDARASSFHPVLVWCSPDPTPTPGRRQMTTESGDDDADRSAHGDVLTRP